MWACGPLNATGAVRAAERAVEQARALDGEHLAPYETVSAELYLAKAREQRGHARYAEAERLANESQALAQRAATKAAQIRDAATPPSTFISRPPEGKR
jgi:hypothetical protein